MAKQKTNFTPTFMEKVSLPSRGIPYGDLIPEKFSIKPLSVKEIGVLYGSSAFSSALDKVLEMVVDVDEFPSKQLLLGDKLYLTYQLRAITFGENYDLSMRCPHCKKQVEPSFNLSTAEIDYAPEDLKVLFEIGPLPVSKDKLTLKLLRVGDYEKIFDRIQEIKKEYPDYEGDPYYMVMTSSQIHMVNGVKMPLIQKEQYTNDMHAMDELYMSQNSEVAPIGPRPNQSVECPECHKNITFQIRVAEDFFRPKLPV